MQAMKQILMEKAKTERRAAEDARSNAARLHNQAGAAEEHARCHEAIALECERLLASYDAPQIFTRYAGGEPACPGVDGTKPSMDVGDIEIAELQYSVGGYVYGPQKK